MNIISMGMELAPNDIQLIVPLITTFCSLLTLLITTLHDDEFYNDDASTYEDEYFFVKIIRPQF